MRHSTGLSMLDLDQATTQTLCKLSLTFFFQRILTEPLSLGFDSMTLTDNRALTWRGRRRVLDSITLRLPACQKSCWLC